MAKKTNSKINNKSNTKNNNTYGEFAGLYDKMSADSHSLQMVPYTLRIFHRFRRGASGAPLRKGLDLCCGTGSATLALAQEGYQMVGVDGSTEMLRHARAKRSKSCSFVHGVLPDFRGHAKLSKAESFDFVVSFYDSLNYLLSEKDLGKAFSNVAELLKPGGLFVFDLNSAEALKVIWGGQVYADAQDDVAWIWKNQYHAKVKMADAHTIFFAKSGKAGLWRRFDETHTEKAYTIACVRRLLKSAGFETLASYNCFGFSAAKAKDYRYCFVARKR